MCIIRRVPLSGWARHQQKWRRRNKGMMLICLTCDVCCLNAMISKKKNMFWNVRPLFSLNFCTNIERLHRYLVTRRGDCIECIHGLILESLRISFLLSELGQGNLHEALIICKCIPSLQSQRPAIVVLKKSTFSQHRCKIPERRGTCLLKYGI